MNILCIIQARMGSERLSGKVIKNILGKPMIEYTLRRVSKSKYINKVILATSNLDREEPLVRVVQNTGFEVFRGDEANVLKRYKDCVDKYNGDIVIRITGDCPIIDPVVIDNVISYFLINDFDYVKLDVPDTFIRGFDVEIFWKSTLDKVYNIMMKEEGFSPYKEHVTLYIYNHRDEFKVGILNCGDLYSKDYRLCVDTDDDFKLVTKIYEHFNDMFVSGKDVVKYLDNNRDIANINAKVEQKIPV